MKGMRKFFGDGGGAECLSLSYWSPDVEAKWIIDDDGADSLQVIYQRKSIGPTYDPETGGPKENPDENFWLYLSPQDARVIGSILLAYAAALVEAVE